MTAFSLALTTEDRLPAELPNLFWDIKELARNYRPKDRDTNNRVLDEAVAIISRAVPIADWPAPLAQRFMLAACALAREALLLGPPDDPTRGGVLTPGQRAAFLCSFAAACPQLQLLGKLQAGSVWVMTCLVTGPALTDPRGALEAALAALEPLHLPPDQAHDQVRAQIVLHVGRLLETGQPVPPAVEDIARQWCADLLGRGQLVNILPRAARCLGVPLTRAEAAEPVVGTTTASAPSRPDAARPAPAEPPTIWPEPEPTTPEERQREFLACLLQLQAVARDKAGPISARTAEGLAELGPRSDPAAGGRALYFAGRELWRGYAFTGDPELLALARRVARLVFHVAPTEGDRRERSGALYLWMNTRLPDLLPAHDLFALLDDARRLYAALGCRPGDLVLRQGMIEAVAGMCHRLETEGDADGRARLIEEKAPALRQVRDELLRRSAEIGYRPSEESAAAWEYLFPAEPREDAAARRATPAPGVLHDPGFREALREGTPDAVRTFVEARRGDIERLLIARLDALPAADRLLWPEGTVRSARAPDAREADPQFAEAHGLLERREYARAADAFRRLADRLPPRAGPARPREVARNFEAFALARLGEPTQARVRLNELMAADVPFPSAYWNCACCVPAADPGARLAVLERGLERAPHPALLCGVVALALATGDEERQRRWLPLLVETEALLLLFRLEFDGLDAAARDRAVLRLARYAIDGAEPPVPDPGDRGLRSGEVHDFLRIMLDLDLNGVAEFWLRCREQEPGVRYRFDFWEAKADFLAACGRAAAAAAAFREEVRCRLNLLRSGRPRGPHIVHSTRRRLEDWLARCATPELRDIGREIYDAVEAFEAQNATHPPLLPRSVATRNYYRAEPATAQPADGLVAATANPGYDTPAGENGAAAEDAAAPALARPAPPAGDLAPPGVPLAAIFLDLANLTGGNGEAILTDLDTTEGEVLVGQFRLATALDRIEEFARRLSPAPVAARWVVNFPVRSAAVVECTAKGYQVENVPPDLFHKGSDDVVLRDKVWEVERDRPAVRHFVLVTGDRDYRLTVDRLLRHGKHVHVIGRARSVAGVYDVIARQYPQLCTVTRLEDLLTRGAEVLQ